MYFMCVGKHTMGCFGDEVIRRSCENLRNLFKFSFESQKTKKVKGRKNFHAFNETKKKKICDRTNQQLFCLTDKKKSVCVYKFYYYM